MLFNLSINNIKKSIKDYSIYFFTLVFAIAMFYMFNSIDAQKSMLAMSNSKTDIVSSLVGVINYLSVFVSVILGFLIIYANNFLIKRRKKEIGLYLTLGMSKRKVSLILVIEFLIIGICSLLVGLLCGVFLSQFLSILTAKVFEVNLTNFHFIFSMQSMLKTILYFGIIFLFVITFNVISLSRYKLIDLIYAGRKNERVKIRNKYLTIITFILAISSIGYAYYLLFNDAIISTDYRTGLMFIFGALGTFLLFFSLSGFLIKLIQRNKKLYYKNLNMFVLKQVNNRINTSVISTTVISLMLLLTIAILSGSISLISAFNTDLKKNNLTDFSARLYYDENVKAEDIYDDDKFNYMVKEYYYYEHHYDDGVTIESLLSKEMKEKAVKQYGTDLAFKSRVPIISESDYNNLMKLFKRNDLIIDINDNEYLITCNIDFIEDFYSDLYNNNGTITVNNHVLKPGSKDIINVAFMNSNSNNNDGIIVISDNIYKSLIGINDKCMVGNYKETDDLEKLDDDFIEYMYSNFSGDIRTKSMIYTSSIGLKAMFTFIGLYLGIVFVICSATILAISQLSESSDNKNRYNILRQLGADNKMIKKALYLQIAVAFCFPLIVAIIHSIVGLSELNSLIKLFGSINVSTNIILTSLFIIILYGGYFLLTCICSKNIIKE